MKKITIPMKIKIDDKKIEKVILEKLEKDFQKASVDGVMKIPLNNGMILEIFNKSKGGAKQWQTINQGTEK